MESASSHDSGSGVERSIGIALCAAVVLGWAAEQLTPNPFADGPVSRDGMPPRELLAAGRAEAAGYGVDLIDGRVVGIEPGFVVHLADRRALHARRRTPVRSAT